MVKVSSREGGEARWKFSKGENFSSSLVLLELRNPWVDRKSLVGWLGQKGTKEEGGLGNSFWGLRSSEC